MSVHDRWGGRRTGDGRRWEVRWRDRGTQRKRRFDSRAAADAWNATVTLRPGEGRVSVMVGDVYTAWLDSRDLRDGTRTGYASAWEVHVESRWGSVPVDAVSAGEVQSWVAELSRRSRSRARAALTVLSEVLRHAVLSGHIEANPCSSVRWPRLSRAEVSPLTLAQVTKLAEVCDPHGLVVWVLATTGMRFGELAGLRVRDLDAGRGRLLVSRSVSDVSGRMVVNPPKSGRAREVPVAGWLAEALEAEAEGREPDDPLLVTERGHMWRRSNWRRVWTGHYSRAGDRQAQAGALFRAGLPEGTRVHDLRHTAAVLMLSSGVSPKTVQAVLGHASLTMTLDLYGRWVSPDLDSAAAVFENVKRP